MMSSSGGNPPQLPLGSPGAAPQLTLSPSVMRCASPTNSSTAASSSLSSSNTTASSSSPWILRSPLVAARAGTKPLLMPLSPSRKMLVAAGAASPSALSAKAPSPISAASASSSPRMPYVRNRRTAVSSEPLEDVSNWVPPVHLKTPEEAEFLKNVTRNKLNLLFQSNSTDNEEKIVRAMFRVRVAPGQELIRQGDEGDNFYIVESGNFDIFVTRPGATVPQLVLQVGPGGSFGELALMYNSPRAATVRATSEAAVWGLDRKSFRQLLVKECVMKKQKHEGLLNKVTIFKCLTKLELCQLSEILQVYRAEPGEVVIKQGTRGDRFYIVESGELVCKMRDDTLGQEIEVMRYSGGGFFGELALITDYGVRKASVIATQPSVLLWIGKTTFDRVLGPIIDTLRRNAHKYPSYAELVARSERRRRV